MKAAFIERTGGPDVVQYGDLPDPTPAPGQVRVRTVAASINPIDIYIRLGTVAAELPKPFVTGSDFAGVVDAVGEGATRFKVGDRVWGSNQGMLGRQGTFAEYVCPHEDYVYPLAPGIDEADAAAVALTGITAHLVLFFAGRLKAGDTVFVNGGTGGVGSLVVQMAKASKATVIATVGSAEKAGIARSLGADLVLNYRTDDIPAMVKDFTKGAGLKLWCETQPPSDFQRTFDMMAPFGRVVVMAGRTATPVFPNGSFYVKGLTLSGFAMFNMPPETQRQCAEEIMGWMKAGKLKPLIGAGMPLAEAAQAHRLQEENSLKKAGTLSGKIVVTM